MTIKRCFKCLCEKPLDEFYRHSAMGDKHLNKCKECTKADVAAHRLANIDRIRQYDRMRASMPHRMAKAKEIWHRWKSQYPNRRAAQVVLGNAVRDGRVVPHPCWVCGAKAEAHHPDYSAPLDVVWLCSPHHKQAHALVANQPDMREVA